MINQNSSVEEIIDELLHYTGERFALSGESSLADFVALMLVHLNTKKTTAQQMSILTKKIWSQFSGYIEADFLNLLADRLRDDKHELEVQSAEHLLGQLIFMKGTLEAYEEKVEPVTTWLYREMDAVQNTIYDNFQFCELLLLTGFIHIDDAVKASERDEVDGRLYALAMLTDPLRNLLYMNQSITEKGNFTRESRLFLKDGLPNLMTDLIFNTQAMLSHRYGLNESEEMERVKAYNITRPERERRWMLMAMSQFLLNHKGEWRSNRGEVVKALLSQLHLTANHQDRERLTQSMAVFLKDKMSYEYEMTMEVLRAFVVNNCVDMFKLDVNISQKQRAEMESIQLKNSLQQDDSLKQKDTASPFILS